MQRRALPEDCTPLQSLGCLVGPWDSRNLVTAPTCGCAKGCCALRCGNFFGFVFLFPSDAGFEASAAAEGYPSGPISNPKHCNYYYYVITFVVRKCVFLKYPGNRTISDLRAHATGLDEFQPRSLPTRGPWLIRAPQRPPHPHCINTYRCGDGSLNSDGK